MATPISKPPKSRRSANTHTHIVSTAGRWTPLLLLTLIRVHVSGALESPSPGEREALAFLERAEMLEFDDLSDPQLTKKARVWLEHLLTTPFPVATQTWSIPERNVE